MAALMARLWGTSVKGAARVTLAKKRARFNNVHVNSLRVQMVARAET